MQIAGGYFVPSWIPAYYKGSLVAFCILLLCSLLLGRLTPKNRV